VILLVCLALGLLLRMASGRHLSDLAYIKLRGETVLLVLLIAQALPSILKLTGPAARVAYVVWVATFPCLIVVAWVNRRSPGMAILGFGLFLNLAVIVLNGGMPVSPLAVTAVKASLAAPQIAATDFVHVLGTSATRLPWLADIIPVTGPSWVTSVASAGDCLLFAGITVFLAVSDIESSGQYARNSRISDVEVE
jgi:hypothetical protein